MIAKAQSRTLDVGVVVFLVAELSLLMSCCSYRPILILKNIMKHPYVSVLRGLGKYIASVRQKRASLLFSSLTVH